MSIIKTFFLLLILSIAVVNGRTLRQRRQTMQNSLRQDVGNFFTNSYNSIRDSVVPAVSSTIDRFSQNWDGYKQNFNQGVNQIGQSWDGYKQNFNQGINQIGQGWNQFRQNFNPQYPYPNNNNYNNNNYGYNQYGYNARQYPYPMNNNYNVAPNMNPYSANYGLETPRGYNPYYTSNVGQQQQQQQYQTFGRQQRSNGPIAPVFATNSDQRPRRRRR